jgi:uncharacterized protein (UPF0147 family)
LKVKRLKSKLIIDTQNPRGIQLAAEKSISKLVDSRIRLN